MTGSGVVGFLLKIPEGGGSPGWGGGARGPGGYLLGMWGGGGAKYFFGGRNARQVFSPVLAVSAPRSENTNLTEEVLCSGWFL